MFVTLAMFGTTVAGLSGNVSVAVVAPTMIPIVALCAWVFQPSVARRATHDGWVVSNERSAGVLPADD